MSYVSDLLDHKVTIEDLLLGYGIIYSPKLLVPIALGLAPMVMAVVKNVQSLFKFKPDSPELQSRVVPKQLLHGHSFPKKQFSTYNNSKWNLLFKI